MVQVTAVSVFAASTIKAPEIYAVQSANKKVTVSWNKVKNADGYSVEYKTTGGKWIAKKTTKKSVVISSASCLSPTISSTTEYTSETYSS